MGDFSYVDIFATKGMDYLIAIICVLALIVLWKWLRKPGKAAGESAVWISSMVGVIAVIVIGAAIAVVYHGGSSGPETKTMNAGLETLPVYGFNLLEVPDGTFRGDSNFGSFSCQVDVTVKDHTIKTVELINNEKGQSPEVKEIFKRVLDEQTPYVSTVSGAEILTRTLLRAIENALLGAL